MFLKPIHLVIGPNDVIGAPDGPQLADRLRGRTRPSSSAVSPRTSRSSGRGSTSSGYTVANDVTARDLQRSDGQWSRAKGFDTFCPVGPVIETDLDVSSATIVTRVNGEVRQDGPVSDMIHDIPTLVAYASAVFTLLPGDLILTGTPAGSAPSVRATSSRSRSAASGCCATPPAMPTPPRRRVSTSSPRSAVRCACSRRGRCSPAWPSGRRSRSAPSSPPTCRARRRCRASRPPR